MAVFSIFDSPITFLLLNIPFSVSLPTLTDPFCNLGLWLY